MRSRRVFLGIVVFALALTACAIPLPPPAVVMDIGALVGTYSGSLKEYGKTPRPAELSVRPDGSFEIVTGGPDGFRNTGVIGVTSSGALVYQTGDSKGTGVVYQGDGRRIIVLTSADRSVVTTVERPLS
jgi:hypothetical protein